MTEKYRPLHYCPNNPGSSDYCSSICEALYQCKKEDPSDSLTKRITETFFPIGRHNIFSLEHSSNTFPNKREY